MDSKKLFVKYKVKNLKLLDGYTIDNLCNDIIEYCEYIEMDGYSCKNMKNEIINYNNTGDLSYLKTLYSQCMLYYDDNKKILDKYESICGYLSCINTSVYQIFVKLNINFLQYLNIMED